MFCEVEFFSHSYTIHIKSKWNTTLFWTNFIHLLSFVEAEWWKTQHCLIFTMKCCRMNVYFVYKYSVHRNFFIYICMYFYINMQTVVEKKITKYKELYTFSELFRIIDQFLQNFGNIKKISHFRFFSKDLIRTSIIPLCKNRRRVKGFF